MVRLLCSPSQSPVPPQVSPLCGPFPYPRMLLTHKFLRMVLHCCQWRLYCASPLWPHFCQWNEMDTNARALAWLSISKPGSAHGVLWPNVCCQWHAQHRALLGSALERKNCSGIVTCTACTQDAHCDIMVWYHGVLSNICDSNRTICTCNSTFVLTLSNLSGLATYTAGV